MGQVIILSHLDDCNNLSWSLLSLLLPTVLHTAAEQSRENVGIMSLLSSQPLGTHLTQSKSQSLQQLMEPNAITPPPPLLLFSAHISTFLNFLHSPWPPNNPLNMPGSRQRVFTPAMSSTWNTLALFQVFQPGSPYERGLLLAILFTLPHPVSHTACLSCSRFTVGRGGPEIPFTSRLSPTRG